MTEYHLLNTDVGTVGRDHPVDAWFDHGIGAVAGNPSRGENLARLSPGDVCLMYKNKVGVLGVGDVDAGWSGSAVAEPVYYTGPGHLKDGEKEYQISVRWWADLRAHPISSKELTAKGVQVTEHAVRTFRTGIGNVERLVKELRARHETGRLPDERWTPDSFFVEARRLSSASAQGLRHLLDLAMSRGGALEVHWGSGQYLPRFIIRQSGQSADLISGWAAGRVNVQTRTVEESLGERETLSALSAALKSPSWFEGNEPSFDAALLERPDVAASVGRLLDRIGTPRLAAGIDGERRERAKAEILDVLSGVARARKTISYWALVQKLRSVHLGPDDPALHAMLGEVSTAEARAGRGMLSVLVVHKTGDMEPGAGFFKLATDLGKRFSDREKFWIEELNLVYAAWSATASPRSSSPPEENVHGEADEGVVNHEQRAAAVWDVLVGHARAKETTTYGALAQEAGGFHHRVLRWPLGLIQDYCINEKLPPLTSLVVHGGDAQPGSGFIAWDADDLETGQRRVFGFDWLGVANPFGYAADGETEEDLAQQLVSQPASAKEVYQLVKVRGKVQAIFRLALLAAYDGACAFCGLSFTEALDAAHIVPWAKCGVEDRMSVNNGLLLCSNHHEMFDADWLRLGEDFKIQYTDMARKHGPYSPMDEALSINFHGKVMKLPSSKKHWPDPKKIRRRYEQ